MKKSAQKFLLVRVSDGEATSYMLKLAKERESLLEKRNARILGEIELPKDTAEMLKNFGIQRLVDRVAAIVEKDFLKMSYVSDIL